MAHTHAHFNNYSKTPHALSFPSPDSAAGAFVPDVRAPLSALSPLPADSLLPSHPLLGGSAFPCHSAAPHRFLLLVFYLLKNLVFHAALSLVFLWPLVLLPGLVCMKGSLAVESKNPGRLWDVLAS